MGEVQAEGPNSNPSVPLERTTRTDIGNTLIGPEGRLAELNTRYQSFLPEYTIFLDQYRQDHPEANPIDSIIAWHQRKYPDSPATREEVIAQLFKTPEDVDKFTQYASSAADTWAKIRNMMLENFGEVQSEPHTNAQVGGEFTHLTAAQLVRHSEAFLHTFAGQVHFDPDNRSTQLSDLTPPNDETNSPHFMLLAGIQQAENMATAMVENEKYSRHYNLPSLTPETQRTARMSLIDTILWLIPDEKRGEVFESCRDKSLISEFIARGWLPENTKVPETTADQVAELDRLFQVIISTAKQYAQT